MRIEAKLNNVHVREHCVACGVFDRPGDVAYFDEDHNCFCDRCIERGEEVIREKFRESAEHYRKHARQYDEAAEEEINILSVPDGVQRGYAELEEMRRPSELDVARAKKLYGNTPSDDDGMAF
jgi:hypothetical protein